MWRTGNVAVAFDEVVNAHPQRVALHYPEEMRSITFADLASLAKKATLLLKRFSVHHGDVVALFQNKSPEAFACMLACIRLGAVYTNLDPNSPIARNEKILGTCSPKVILTDLVDAEFIKGISRLGVAPVGGLRDLSKLNSEGHEPTSSEAIRGTDPCYLMYTSGSTGLPKGVVISHDNVVSFVGWAKTRFSITENDVFTNVNPIYFDNSVFDFYVSMLSGATLVPFTAKQMKRPREVLDLMDRAQCTIWFSVPSLLIYFLTTKVLNTDSLKSFRKIIFGGEGFPKSKLKTLYDLFGSRIELENVYGPTECTCICSAHTINGDDFSDMGGFATLGRLAAHFSGEILPLDPEMPDYGELVLFGPAVGLGYFDDPGRSSAAFIQNPTHNKYRDIGYRTGDLVRKDRNGSLYFKGRSDYQIKHLGYRIELEEIEAALNALNYVRESAVIYAQSSNGTGSIYGFIATDETFTSRQIISHLSNAIPQYMMPSKVVSLKELPKNPNGKIDRNALREGYVG